MSKVESGEHVFYLTSKQKEAVDKNLKKVTRGNYNMRKYKYYYFLHIINVNGSFGKKDRTYISTTMLHQLFKDWTFIKEMKINLISWGLVEVVTKQFYNNVTNEGKCSSYAITDEYKGDCDYKLNISYYNSHCRFIKKIIAKKHTDICNYNELETNIYNNLLKLSVVAPQSVIDESLMLHKISRNDFNISTWSTGRIGYEFTGVERINRKYLRLDGKELIEVDIVNCQILLATILFKRYFKDVRIPDDLIRLIEICEQGSFYEEMMSFLKMPLKERELFKNKVFELFFAPNYPNESKLLLAFKSMFPEVAAALYAIKKSFYKNFAREIQGIESTIIFNVYQKLVDRGISALTIHDSIVVSTENDAVLTKELLINEFSLNYNLTPKLKTKYYKAEQNQETGAATQQIKSIPSPAYAYMPQTNTTFDDKNTFNYCNGT